jgi:hypothetical protein
MSTPEPRTLVLDRGFQITEHGFLHDVSADARSGVAAP